MAKKKATKRKTSKKAKGSEPETAAVPGKGNPGSFPMLGGVGAALAGQIGGGQASDKKKNGKPQVQCNLTNGEGELWVGVYVRALREKKTAEAEMSDAFGVIAPVVEKARIEASRRSGEFYTSVDVNGRLTFVRQHKYLEIKPERAEALQGLFGEADFQKFFKAVTDVKLKMDKLEEDPDLAQALIQAVQGVCEQRGMALSDVLDSKMVIKPTEELSRARVMNAEVGRKFEEAEDAGLVAPAKATLKEK